MRAAIAIACVLCASTASAQGIGRELMEKMSGPDPRGIEIRFPIFCQWENDIPDGDKSRRAIGYWQTPLTKAQPAVRADDNQRRFCVDAGFWTFSNADREDEGFHVSGQRLEVGFTWRLDQYKPSLRFLQPGVTVGAIGFLTDNHREWRLDVAGRIVIRPLDLVESLRNNRWGSVVQITIRPEGLFPGVSDDDLGANPLDPFNHRFRLGGSWRRAPFVVLDFSEVARLR